VTDKLTPYLGSVLSNFENGGQLDLRLRLAVDFIKAAPGLFTEHGIGPARALDMASELLAEAERRGLLLPLPDDNGLNAPLRKHLERNVRAQIYQQAAAQRIAQEESPKVIPPGAMGTVIPLRP